MRYYSSNCDRLPNRLFSNQKRIMSKKYKYLKAVSMVYISKLLGYRSQGIRADSPSHEPLLKALNDAIGEAIEKVVQKFGGTSYKKKHWKDQYK